MAVLSEPDEDQLAALYQRRGASLCQVQELGNKLRQWVTLQPHLPPVSVIDDKILCKFALGGKCDLKYASTKLDGYYTVRGLIPEFFTQRDPLSEEIQCSVKTVYLGLLPGLTPDGSRVMFLGLRLTDPAHFDILPLLRRFYSLMDTWLRQDPHVNSMYLLCDASEGTLAHMLKVSPRRARDASFCLQNVYPVKIKGIIFINVHPLVRTVLENIVKPLFKKKLAKRFSIFSGDMEDLAGTIPKSILSQDYGGSAPSLEQINDSWNCEMCKERDWLLTVGTATTDEAKRKNKCPEEGTLSVERQTFYKLVFINHKPDPSLPVGPISAPGCTVM